MRYKYALFLIAECLRLKVSESRKSELIAMMLSEKVCWEDVVRIASEHLVLPLFYIRMKEANLLLYVPNELRIYLEEITNLNRVRNKSLLEEVSHMNNLLLENGIQAIYLKGTAHLLKGMYDDIGERMLGDIDLLVAPDKMLLAAQLLENYGYKPLEDYNPATFDFIKHYPRLAHPSKIFAVEIHKDLIQKVSKRKLGYKDFDTEKEYISPYYLPSVKHLIFHNALNTQLNDNGYLLGILNLRQQYDLLLLSQAASVKETIENSTYFKRQMRAYLVKTNFIFKNTKTLNYKKTMRSRIQMFFMEQRFKNPRLFKFINQVLYICFKVHRGLYYIAFNLMKPTMRKGMLSRLKDEKYIKAYFLRFYNKIHSL